MRASHSTCLRLASRASAHRIRLPGRSGSHGALATRSASVLGSCDRSCQQRDEESLTSEMPGGATTVSSRAARRRPRRSSREPFSGSWTWKGWPATTPGGHCTVTNCGGRPRCVARTRSAPAAMQARTGSSIANGPFCRAKRTISSALRGASRSWSHRLGLRGSGRGTCDVTWTRSLGEPKRSSFVRAQWSVVGGPGSTPASAPSL